jgi:hypothetical protein
MIPSEYNETFSAPESSRNTHFQITPAALAGMAHGRSIPARKNPLPKKGSLRSSATSTPSATSTGTATTIKSAVVRVASRKYELVMTSL